MYSKTVGRDQSGLEFPIPEMRAEGIVLYNGTGSAIAAGDVFMVGYSSTALKEESVAACATSAIPRRIVVANESIAAGDYGKFTYKGKVKASIVDTAGVAAGQYVEVLNTADDFNTDGASLTVESAGMLLEAVTSGEGGGSPVLKYVWLFGIPCQIKAS